MIFELCDSLREIIGEMNDKILDKLRELDKKDSIDEGLKTLKISSDAPMNYTPVNKQTFALWCAGYMEKLQKIKEENRTERDSKPTGRQLFEKNKEFLNFKLEADDEEGEEDDNDNEEFKNQEDSGEDEAFCYDKELYAEVNEDEDVDFD